MYRIGYDMVGNLLSNLGKSRILRLNCSINVLSIRSPFYLCHIMFFIVTQYFQFVKNVKNEHYSFCNMIY